MFGWLYNTFPCIKERGYSFSVGNGGQAVMFVKNLVHIKGYRLDLHKMIRADNPECYHSHPAKAFRIIVWGGYIEEVFDTYSTHHAWIPGMMGLVRPTFVHRVHALLGKASYSLWIRGPIVAKIKLYGTGWKEDELVEAEY